MATETAGTARRRQRRSRHHPRILGRRVLRTDEALGEMALPVRGGRRIIREPLKAGKLAPYRQGARVICDSR
jgi:hypothetical protein